MATGGAGPEWIEIIDADPSAFGAGASLSADRPRPAWVRGGSRSVVGLVVLALVGGAAVVGTRLQPWHRGPHSLSFPAPGVVPAGDGHWVFDTPPGTLVGAGTGTPAPNEPGSYAMSEFTGYVFADADASIGFVRGASSTGRSAMFSTRTYDALVTGGTAATVQGVPAVITQAVNATTNRIDVEFGPIDGQLFDVTAEHLTMQEALRFADAVGLRDGTPTISDDRALAGMQPVVGARDLTRVYSLLSNTGEQSIPQTWLVFASYRSADGIATVGSIPFAGSDVPRLLRLLLPGGVERTVHGVTGLAAADAVRISTDPFSNNSVVMWQEDGRLVMVSSSGTIDATVALAETVRAATAAEWGDVVDVAARTPNPLSSKYDPPKGTEITLLDSIDPNGGQFTLSATWQHSEFTACAIVDGFRTCARSSPFYGPTLIPLTAYGMHLVVAVVPAEETNAPEVRVRHATSHTNV